MDRKNGKGVEKMKVIPFLTEAEIEKLKQQESESDDSIKKSKEQIEAIYTSGQNILVSASAGSGKTFVMTERILDQLSRGIDISQLFISTFTVKAANELKERLEKNISQKLQETTDLHLKQHLARQLADLPNAAIGTMDSFTQKFLLEHGYLIEIAPNFRILENDRDQLLLKNEVFHNIFDKYYKNQQTKDFYKLVRNFAGNRKDESNFKNQVYKIYDFVQSTSNPQKWLKENFLKGFEDADFTIEKDKLTEPIKNALFDLESFLRYHQDNDAKEFGEMSKKDYRKNIPEFLDMISSLNYKSTTEDYREVLLRVIDNKNKLVNRKKKPELPFLKKAYNDEKNEHFVRLEKLDNQIKILNYQKRYHEETWALAKIFQSFMIDFVEAYRQRKRQENAYEFADISHYTIEILEKFPQVRKDYQERFHEVMVDEYQDTNHIQERMIELLSNGNNRFMVGDIKQSIYRFRQADPQIFNDKFQLYSQNSQEGKLILLKENFRSSSEVLSATNAVFERLMDKEVGEISYDDMHKLVYANSTISPNPENKAELILYDESDDEVQIEDSDTSEDQIADEATNNPNKYRLLALKIKTLQGEIEDQIANYELEINTIKGKLADVTDSDKEELNKKIKYLQSEINILRDKPIAILVSTRTYNSQIIQTLSDFGIATASDSGEQIYLKSLEVQVMLETLRVLHNPLQDYSLVALMKSPMFNFDEDELARLSLQSHPSKNLENLYTKLLNAKSRSGSQNVLITEQLFDKLTRFLETLASWRSYAKTHSLYDLIWKIYNDRFYYDYVGAMPNGAVRQANLYSLAIRADQFEKNNFKGLSNFINLIDKILDLKKDLDEVPAYAPQNAVQLMTIHKSKGLEFPYVFIVGLEKIFNQSDTTDSITLNRNRGLGFNYIADIKTSSFEQAMMSNTIKLSIPSLTYSQNVEESKVATYSEQMRLLYVAMTRAVKKLYLIGSSDLTNDKEAPAIRNGLLSSEVRLESKNFLAWILGICRAFPDVKDSLDYYTIKLDELNRKTTTLLDTLTNKKEDSQAHNRQSETIREALDMLKVADEFNIKHQAAINLPRVQTPSQLKNLNNQLKNSEEVSKLQMKKGLPSIFELPDFSSEHVITGAEIGSATHELMQRLDLSQEPTIDSLKESLDLVQIHQSVKDKINLPKILSFFEIDLGKEILSNKDKLYREQPFSMLKTDEKSNENFVVRGILDGYLLFEDHIVLFDYKTDRYEDSSELVERYRGQLSLYEEGLTKAYGISKIDKYLILFGKEEVEVVRV